MYLATGMCYPYKLCWFALINYLWVFKDKGLILMYNMNPIFSGNLATLQGPEKKEKKKKKKTYTAL